jgi:putative tricarboxylic transport membrane protein
MKRYDYPLAPVILGIVLGPLIDNNFRRSMIMTDGSLVTLLTRPGTAVILVVAIAFFLIPYALRLYGRRRGRNDMALLVDDAE